MDAPSWSSRPALPGVDEPEPEPAITSLIAAAASDTATSAASISSASAGNGGGGGGGGTGTSQAHFAGWLWLKGGLKEDGSKVGSWRKGARRNWKRRYFTQDGRTLCFHTSSQDALLRKPPLGRLDLALFELRHRDPTPERQWAFCLISAKQDYPLCAASQTEKSIWMDAIRTAQHDSVATLSDAGGPVLVSSSNHRLVAMSESPKPLPDTSRLEGASSEEEDFDEGGESAVSVPSLVPFSAADGDAASHQGWLVKRGRKRDRKAWNRRWFVLSQHQFSYYRNKPEMGDVARCVFDLTDCAIEAGDPAQMSFAVCGAAGDLVLQAADLVDMTRWIKELAKGIEIGKREREREQAYDDEELDDADVYVERPWNVQLQKAGSVSRLLWSFVHGCILFVGRSGIELIEPEIRSSIQASRVKKTVTVPKLRGMGEVVVTVCANDDDVVLLGTSDGRLIGICTQLLEVVWVVQCSRSKIICLSIDVPDGPYGHVWCGSEDGSVAMIHLEATPSETPRVAFSQSATPTHPGAERVDSSPVVDIALSGGLVWTATYGQVSVRAWDMSSESRACVHSVHCPFRVTCLLARHNEIWVGQGDGGISVFDNSTYTQTGNIVSNASEVIKLVTAGQRVWSMHANGTIRVIGSEPLSLLASFPAHNSITGAVLVPMQGSHPFMWTVSNVGSVRVWNSSFPDTRNQVLAKKMDERKAEYTETRTLKVRVVTYNVAEESPTEAGNEGLRDVWCSGAGDKGVIVEHKPFENVHAAAARQWLNDKSIEKANSVLAALEAVETDPATWVHELQAMESDGSLAELVEAVNCQQTSSPTRPRFDVIAIGLQEVEMTGKALAAGLVNSDTEKGRTWSRSIQSVLAKEGFVNAGERQLVGLFCAVYVHRDHLPFLQDVQVKAIGCGLGGFAGNKGGVLVRLKLYETELTFVNTHLAAHMNHVSKRNEDFESVAEALMPELITAANRQGGALELAPSSPLIWFGDLNYRIPLEFEEVINAIDSNDLASIIAHDQLVVERDAQRVFLGFTESPILFAPTYKFRAGTTDYDRREKKKSAAKGGGKKPPRVPAYCDRVLWCGPGIRPLVTASTNHPLGYTSHLHVTASDHKPVSHSLLIDAQKILPDRHEVVRQEVLQEVSVLEDAAAPALSMNVSDLDFGNVRFNDAKTQAIVLTNSGSASANFFFGPACKYAGDKTGAAIRTGAAAAEIRFDAGAAGAVEEKAFPRWIRLSPTSGQILPGCSCRVRVTVAVNRSSSRHVPVSGDLVAQIILHMHSDARTTEVPAGNTLTIAGRRILGCWGQGLDELHRRPFPLRGPRLDPSAVSPPGERGTGRKEDWEGGTCLPDEVQCLLDWLHKTNQLSPQPLFIGSGDADEVDLLVDLLETVGHIDTFRGHAFAVADCLLTLLNFLPRPIFLEECQARVFEAAETADLSGMVSLLSQLPACHRTVVRDLLRISDHLLHGGGAIASGDGVSSVGGSLRVTAGALAEVLAPVLFRPVLQAESRASQVMQFLFRHLKAAELQAWLRAV